MYEKKRCVIAFIALPSVQATAFFAGLCRLIGLTAFFYKIGE